MSSIIHPDLNVLELWLINFDLQVDLCGVDLIWLDKKVIVCLKLILR